MNIETSSCLEVLTAATLRWEGLLSLLKLLTGMQQLKATKPHLGVWIAELWKSVQSDRLSARC